jgi:hypothetical protein
MPLRIGGADTGKAAVDDHVTAGMGDQVPGHRDIERLAEPLVQVDVLAAAAEAAGLKEIQADVRHHVLPVPDTAIGSSFKRMTIGQRSTLQVKINFKLEACRGRHRPLTSCQPRI